MDSQKFFCIFFILFTIIGNCFIKCTEGLREKYITSVQDGRLKFNESINLEDLKNPHGFLNLRNSLNSDIDLEDALQDFHIINAITSSINQWKLKKHLKNFSNSTKKRVKRDEEVVCYRNFGCFRDEGPFDYLDTLPASPDTINTTFTLFTREEKNGESLNYLNSTTITNSKISTDRPIKIIIHGFGSSGKRPWVVQMTEALIYMEDVNVIVVDWEAGAALPNYVQAAANTQLVGKQIARLINTINQNLKFKPEDYHLIGFSLGAHIAGFAGAEVKNISRITGLDPASPLFEGYSVRARLDPSDAKFVDVIHSNGDSFLKGGFGSFKPMGHLDFYPNGGRVQVGCNSVFVGAITDIFYGKWQSLCHHRRAFRFFIDSLVPSCRFHAFACDSYEKFLKGECFNCGESGRRCANMGYYAGFSKGRGKMYLMTRNKEPFCANQYKIRILSSNTQHSTWGKLEISFISKDANETFPLTSESDEIKDKAILQGLVVAHPIIRNITHVSLKYTKYRGWIYSGKDFWAVDKIILQNSDGEVFSYCGFNTIIQNNESVLLDLERTNCTLFEPSNDLPTARVARLIWKVVSKPVRPSFFWRLTEYNPITKLNHNSNSNNLGSNTINYNSFNLNSGVHSINPDLINSSNQNKPYLAFMNSNLNQLSNLNKIKNLPTTTLRHNIPLTSITTTTTSSKNDTPKNLFYKTTDRTNSQINNNQLQNDVDSNEKQNTQYLQQALQSHQQINLEEDININTFNSTTQSNQSNSSLINLAINLPTKNISSTASFE